MQICILVANIIAVTADLIIIQNPIEFFVSGLAVFLLAHVMYITAFSVPSTPNKDQIPAQPIRIIPILVITLPIFIWLLYSMIVKKKPDYLVVAVAIYGATETMSLWRIFARFGYPTEKLIAQVVAFVGMLSFVISDVILATNKFIVPVFAQQIWILGLYWLGNALIVFSMMVPWGKEEEEDSTEMNFKN